MIEFKPVTIENFLDIIDLKVEKTQEEYVYGNLFLLAQSKVQQECIPLAIYSNDLLVGFLMYGIDRGDNNYWIYHLMIDKKHQGKGYGQEALEKIITMIKEQIKENNKTNKILLMVNKEDKNAIKIYEKNGFVFNGKKFGEASDAIVLYKEHYSRLAAQGIKVKEYIMELIY
ncbi:hypothetical protein FACS1894147_09630 [Spirochaetia bacterium]|nr:hypothetical protein FACS1894147_09630 [Spirochaetia bacterium]